MARLEERGDFLGFFSSHVYLLVSILILVSLVMAPTVFFLPFLVLELVLVLWPLEGRPMECLKPLYDLILFSISMLFLMVLFSSPSTSNSLTWFCSFSIWSLVRSLARKSGLMDSFFSMSRAVFLPIPKIYVRETLIGLASGMFTPDILGIIIFLPLALFMAWISTNYVNLAMAFDNFTVNTSKPNRGLYFHFFI